MAHARLGAAMSRLTEMRKAVEREATKWGYAIAEHSWTGSSHQKFRLQRGNKFVTVFTSGTPSDRNAPNAAAHDVRRKVRQAEAMS
jgi:hypothetical protein